MLFEKSTKIKSINHLPFYSHLRTKNKYNFINLN